MRMNNRDYLVFSSLVSMWIDLSLELFYHIIYRIQVTMTIVL